MKKNILIILSAFMLSSCLAVKKYTPPQAETNNLYRDVNAEDANSLGDLSWEQLFTDTILQGYIQQALKHNYDVRIAVENLNKYQSMFKQAKNTLPTASGNLRWNYTKYASNSPFARLASQLSQLELSSTLSWEADIWGKARSNKRAALASLMTSQATFQLLQTQVISDVAMGYFMLMSLDEKLKVTKEALENRIQSVEVVRALKISGIQTEVSVKQLEAQQYGAEVAIKDLEYQINVQENALNILLGYPAGSIERGSLDKQTVTSDIKAGLPARLLSNRPDVLQAEYKFMNAFELRNLAKSSLYPSLTISPTLGLQATNNFSLITDPNSFFVNMISGLTMPILNRRTLKTNLETATSTQEIAFLEYHKTLLLAGKEVSEALLKYNTESAKLESRQKQVANLRDAVAFSNDLLKYGSINYLTLLTAQNDVLNAETSLLDNRYQQMKAVIDLYRALGGGANL